MKTLTMLQSAQVSGGQAMMIEEFIPEQIPGLSLIGWQKTIVDWNITTWEEKGWFFTSYHTEKSPIFEFTPVYA